jgi:ubiquitin carboxyl-terminal hydrolase 34
MVRSHLSLDTNMLIISGPVIPAAATPFLNYTLLQRLLGLLSKAKLVTTSQNSIDLTCRSFQAILDASLHNPELWVSFKAHLENSDLLRDLILGDSRPAIRKEIMKQVLDKCVVNQR